MHDCTSDATRLLIFADGYDCRARGLISKHFSKMATLTVDLTTVKMNAWILII